MPLTTAMDLAILSSWNWVRDYARTRNKTAFIQVGKIVYQTLTPHGGSPPSGPNAVEQPLSTALRVANIFKILCQAKPHANPTFYPIFAESLTRYILDNEWNEIIKP